MDSTYKYPYIGNDEYLLYFSNHYVKEWDFSNFQNFFTLNKPRKLANNRLFSFYIRSLQTIKDNNDIPISVKEHIDNLLKLRSEKNSGSNITNNYNNIVSVSGHTSSQQDQLQSQTEQQDHKTQPQQQQHTRVVENWNMEISDDSWIINNRNILSSFTNFRQDSKILFIDNNDLDIEENIHELLTK
ncbi:unnamed protein product [Cunninghamella echinulata]